MGRNYRKELRERGIVVPYHGQSPACQAWNAWLRMNRCQRQAFASRAGLMPIARTTAAATANEEGTQDAPGPALQ
jgi:hypothetical protein